MTAGSRAKSYKGKSGQFLYRLKSTGAGSDRFGVCEVCGRHCSEVFLQHKTEEGTYDARHEAAGLGKAGETFTMDRGYTFGHQSCLKKVQR